MIIEMIERSKMLFILNAPFIVIYGLQTQLKIPQKIFPRVNDESHSSIAEIDTSYGAMASKFI